MSLQSELLAYIKTRQSEDPHLIAEGFLASRTKRMLVPILAEEVVHLRRDLVRGIEVHVLTEIAPGPRRLTTAHQVREALGGLAPLLDQPYRIGDGRERRAGEMTLEEWQLRRTMLLSQINGITRSIAVCDEAIAVLEKTRARCLDALRGEEAQAA
jgi:hypothetical protein